MYPDSYIWKSSHYNHNLGRTKALKVKADSYNNKITYCTFSFYRNMQNVQVLLPYLLSNKKHVYHLQNYKNRKYYDQFKRINYLKVYNNFS